MTHSSQHAQVEFMHKYHTSSLVKGRHKRWPLITLMTVITAAYVIVSAAHTIDAFAIITPENLKLSIKIFIEIIVFTCFYLIFSSIKIIIQRCYFYNIYHALQQSQELHNLPGCTFSAPLRWRHAAAECQQIILRAIDLERQHRAMSLQLQAARKTLNEQATTLALQRHTHDEVQQSFLHVLNHANRLEESIRTHHLNDIVTTGIDPLCEHAFNLQLLTKGMAQLHQNGTENFHRLPITQTVSGMLIALTSALDRRCMQLTSHQWEESLHAFAGHTHGETMLWLLLLGCIRYAADESTLSLGCRADIDHAEAVISIEITELSPGHITPEERMRYFAAKAVHHECETHLFAHTLKANANLILADLLAKRAQGSVQIIPKTSYSCEVQLRLRLA
jgi:hypothetical protein